MQVPNVGNEFQLSDEGPAEYYFVLEDVFDALAWDVKWSAAGLVISITNGVEPFLKNVLRFSSECDFNLLSILAVNLGIQKPRGYSRAELLTAAANIFGDEEFTKSVLMNDKKVVSKSGSAEDLSKFVLDVLDKAEQADFKDIKQHIERRDKQLKTDKWKKLLKEKKDSCL